MPLLLGHWEHGTPKTIAYCLSLGLVGSTGPCSKSSAAGMPSPEAMKCGLLDAGDTSSGAPLAKSPLIIHQPIATCERLAPSWPFLS